MFKIKYTGPGPVVGSPLGVLQVFIPHTSNWITGNTIQRMKFAGVRSSRVRLVLIRTK